MKNFEVGFTSDKNIQIRESQSFDEPMPPSMGQYTKSHTKKWAETISSFDGMFL